MIDLRELKVAVTGAAVEATAQECPGLRATCVMPGPLHTPAGRAALPESAHAALVAPGAVADVILFLLSGLGRPINGAGAPAYGSSPATEATDADQTR